MFPLKKNSKSVARKWCRLKKAFLLRTSNISSNGSRAYEVRRRRIWVECRRHETVCVLLYAALARPKMLCSRSTFRTYPPSFSTENCVKATRFTKRAKNTFLVLPEGTKWSGIEYLWGWHTFSHLMILLLMREWGGGGINTRISARKIQKWDQMMIISHLWNEISTSIIGSGIHSFDHFVTGLPERAIIEIDCS